MGAMAHERTVLVVDDNPANRDLRSRRLARKGFAVRVAEDGEKALGLLGRERVDLVLLDVMMPGLSGLEVLSHIRKTRSPAELPVIMVTAKTDSEDVVDALERGANDYVTKPIDFPVVLARVQAQLRVKQAVAAAQVTEAGLTSPAQLQTGMVLGGRYRLDERIGVGNFGTVYRATHLELKNAVAMKVLGTSVAGDPDSLARFRREGISACRVRHPNAVAVLDFGVTEGGIAFLVMELLEGHSLDRELASHAILPPDRCAHILVPVCGALATAHAAGIVHRDIKPSNVFLHRAGRREVPKVLDFGIARLAGENALGGHLTVDGSLLGTPAYMAPERFRHQPYDGKSDIYSLGVTLFQMLGGRLPFVPSSKDPMALAMMQASEAPPSLRALNPAVPEAVERVVLSALDKDPAQRPDAEELARALAIAAGMPVRARRAGPKAPPDPSHPPVTPPTPQSQAASPLLPRPRNGRGD
jgi:CheY-like chemotaxis protein